MLFVPSNIEDIQRYYKSTFVKFPETGDKLFYIKNVNVQKVSGTDNEGTPFELLLSEDFPYDVDYILPKKSYFQMGNYACLLQRVPAKQYSRGITENNVNIARLGSNGSTNGIPVGFEALLAYIAKPNFSSIQEALRNNNRDKSVALSPRMAFVQSTRTFYIDNIDVGRLDTKAQLLKCFSPLFAPELSAVVNGTSYKVVV